jgi:hypothetical protein
MKKLIFVVAAFWVCLWSLTVEGEELENLTSRARNVTGNHCYFIKASSTTSTVAELAGSPVEASIFLKTISDGTGK